MANPVTFTATFNDVVIGAIKARTTIEYNRMMDEIVEEAIREAPVGETHTLASPQTIKKIRGADGETNVVAETQGKPYPSWVEHGTFEQQAQPYMWPAYRKAKTRFFKRIRGIF